MEGNTVTAATGSLGPVIAKLTHLLGKEYQLQRQTRSDITLITSNLKSIHSLLWKRWGREPTDLEEASDGLKISIASSPAPLIAADERAPTDLKMEALEVADDIEDAVDDFLMKLRKNCTTEEHTRIGCTGGRELKTADTVRRSFRQTHTQPLPFQDLMEKVCHVSKRCRSKWKGRNALTICSSSSSSSKPLRVDPRAPFLAKDSSQLVCMDRRMDKPVKFLVEKEGSNLQPQLKMLSITGSAGVGKTALAHHLYGAIGGKFHSRAIVSLTPRPNMKEILTSILKQVTADSTTVPFPGGTEGAANEKNLILKTADFLKDKRYLVIIDDIWQLEAWETIKKCLPKNTIGSRIVMTTRNNDIAEKCSDGSDALVYKINFLGVNATRKMVIKANIVGQGFKHSHPVVRMCGGMPLALGCMLAAVAREQNQQGPGVKISHVQDKIVKQVQHHGIKNSLEFQPLEASLQVGYDDLPHHMLKSCLLYCSIYPENWRIARNHLVGKWMYEGLVDGEKAAKNYFDELVNRGWIQLRKEYEEEEEEEFEEDEDREEEIESKKKKKKKKNDVEPVGGHYYTIHPMVRNYLQWKSREDNFITYISDNHPSCGSGISRMCLDHIAEEQVKFPGMKLSRIRSLVVFGDAKRVDFKRFKGLRVLDLQYSTGLQNDHVKDICGLLCVRHLLGLHGKGITEIPPEIVRLEHLETLDMRRSRIRKLPNEMRKMQQLKSVDVSGTMVTELQGEMIKELLNLEALDVSHTGLRELPVELRELLHLKILDVSHTYITELPREMVGCLLNLEGLLVSHTGITELPKEIMKLKRLKTLDASHTRIRKLHGEMIKELLDLESLDVSHTEVAELPKEIENLEHLVSLDVSHNDGLAELPVEIGKLKRLKALDASGTLLSEMPSEIGLLEELETLNLDATSKLTRLPREIGNLKRLKTMCLHPGLRTMPWEVAKLSRSLRVPNYGKVVILPECVCQAWKHPTLPRELEEEGVILHLDMIDQFNVVKDQVVEAALIVSSQNLRIPDWINLHFRDLTYLDIRVCDLDEEGLNVLGHMPYLHTLVVKVEVVPTEPIAITCSAGFRKVQVFVVESRFPRVTFQSGAMPKLKHIMLLFRTYAGPAHEDSPMGMGLTNLHSLTTVIIWRNYYYTEYNPCIAGTIRVVRKEAAQHRNKIDIGGMNTDAYT